MITSWAPPYLPSFEQFQKDHLTDDVKTAFREQGIEAGCKAVGDEGRRQIQRGRLWNYFRGTYTTVFSVVFAVTVFPSVNEHVQKSIQEKVRVHFQEVTSNLNNIATNYEEIQKMTPEQQGEADFNRFVQFMKTQGYKVDVNLPEFKEERRKRIQIYIDLAKNSIQSKKNPEP